MFFRSLVSRFVIPSYIPRSDENIVSLDLNDASVFLPLAAIDFGVVFNSLIQNNMMLDGTVIQEVKHTCMGILHRLPENIRLWKSLSFFRPAAVLSQVRQPLISISLCTCVMLMYSLTYLLVY